jgi:hypothetical protein
VSSRKHSRPMRGPPALGRIPGERWGIKRVYEDLTERFSGFLSTGLHAQAADRKELLAYVDVVFRRTPMYFAAPLAGARDRSLPGLPCQPPRPPLRAR